MKIELLNNVTLFQGDCRDTLRSLPDNSVDSVPCDPPYELNFMGKGWDRSGIANDPEFWREVYRVLKPGGHLAAFSASRTYHRMACAIEDAGFEIRDSLMWLYGVGFPKSLDVSKGIDKAGGDALVWKAFSREYAAAVIASDYTHSDIDKALGIKSSSCYWARTDHRGGMPPRHHWEKVRAMLGLSDDFERLYEGAERAVIGQKTSGIANKGEGMRHTVGASSSVVVDVTAPATPAAAEWEGWGTALKPAFEPIVLARKPLSEPTVAANVLKWRTGALNIDGCRVGDLTSIGSTRSAPKDEGTLVTGRWPANVVTDGSDEVVEVFPNNSARFFYSAKASKTDRAGSKHPTVKPIALMQWLARLITPPGGTVLDPFAGSGTTGAAAVAEGFYAILCERESEYVADIKRRIGEPLTVNEPAREPFPWE